jgi:hypothetical protein
LWTSIANKQITKSGQNSGFLKKKFFPNLGYLLYKRAYSKTDFGTKVVSLCNFPGFKKLSKTVSSSKFA